MASSLIPLVGPPEIHRENHPLSTAQAVAPSIPPPAESDDPFISAMVAHFNDVVSVPPMGFTENNSATFLATGNPCLDFFFHVVPDTPPETIASRLQESWSHHPLTTLKLICNLRGVRGTGKSDKEGFYTAALWIHKHHPKTLAVNVSSLAEFGYFKDLPEILYRLLEGPDVRKIVKKGRKTKAQRKAQKTVSRSGRRKRNTTVLNSDSKTISKAVSITKEKAREVREQRRVDLAKKALNRFNLDPDYRFLHDRISDLFAGCLKSDVESLNSGQTNKIGLAAKWCPSLDSSFDRSTLLCETVARKMFPRESLSEYAGIDDAHYAYRVRDRLRKEVLVPLRRALELPEVYMSANRWSELPYSRVASVAMKTYKEHFQKHDPERFSAYLESVKSGEAKIAAGALLPHEVIKSLRDEDGGAVAELQWRRMVDDLAQKGKMKNCIAVADVSASMSGIPMQVSIALGILVSELSEEPWKGKVITFSENPQLQVIEGEDLKSKVSFVEEMDWGGSTDFQKVFDAILEVTVKARLKPDQMIKRVFVLSDMEFDEASANPWETDYMVIKRKYEEKGYVEAVPEIVFWNLRDSLATPVPGDQKGVALVSGFSKNLLTMFLGNDGILSPLDVMEGAISGEAYQKLVVVD
ncbi:hypothetical protein V2J09_024078 [Rumex salicifolius]